MENNVPAPIALLSPVKHGAATEIKAHILPALNVPALNLPLANTSEEAPNNKEETPHDVVQVDAKEEEAPDDPKDDEATEAEDEDKDANDDNGEAVDFAQYVDADEENANAAEVSDVLTFRGE